MKKRLLSCALLGALGMAQSAMAQDFDDRWYVTGGAGVGFFDRDRHVSDELYGTLGFGKFVTRNISIDAELWHSDPDLSYGAIPSSSIDSSSPALRNWEMLSLSVVGRYHFIQEGRDWNPYVAFGLGAQRHHDGSIYSTTIGFAPSRAGTNLLASFGAGIQKDLGRVMMRGEVGLRYDADDNSLSSHTHLMDGYMGASLLVPLGAKAEPPPPPPPAAPVEPQKTCADMDDDGDGVNNCDDKCPASTAGQAVGPDGCPVPLTIDLKGVNFDFDKDTLRPDAEAILAEAVSILQKYPQLKVEVAGHTDSVGTEQYNQGLSERRAKAVYDYLTGHGIDAGRLSGPTGYGESRPIAPNTNEDGSDNPEGRARNRRTELNVQNKSN